MDFQVLKGYLQHSTFSGSCEEPSGALPFFYKDRRSCHGAHPEGTEEAV